MRVFAGGVHDLATQRLRHFLERGGHEVECLGRIPGQTLVDELRGGGNGLVDVDIERLGHTHGLPGNLFKVGGGGVTHPSKGRHDGLDRAGDIIHRLAVVIGVKVTGGFTGGGGLLLGQAERGLHFRGPGGQVEGLLPPLREHDGGTDRTRSRCDHSSEGASEVLNFARQGTDGATNAAPLALGFLRLFAAFGGGLRGLVGCGGELFGRLLGFAVGGT